MAWSWDDVAPWSRPAGLTRRTGTDELGNPVMQDLLSGQQLFLDYPDPQAGLRAIAAEIAQGPQGPTVYGRPTAREVTNWTPDLSAVAQALAGVGGAMMEGFTAPGRAAQGETMTIGDVMSTALDYGLLGAPMAAPAGSLRAGAVRTADNGIIAYHGSPHTFDRFSMDAIGTGEGAQAYGHGLYFAENEGVAQQYRQALRRVDETAFSGVVRPGTERDAFSFARTGADPETAAREFGNWTRTPVTDDIIGAFRQAMAQPGSMYQVRINADPASMLDWDAPLSAQSPQVREALTQAGIDLAPRQTFGLTPDGEWGPLNVQAPNYPGADAYRMMRDPEAASETLRQAGIPGISYLDAGSRAAGTGTRNYVVFDADLIDILKRYGIGTAAVGGGWELTQDQAREADNILTLQDYLGQM